MLRSRDGDILAYNKAAQRILGLSQEQVTGRAPIDLRWQTLREDNTPFLAEHHPGMITLLTGQPQEDVVMGIHKPDGEITWVSINAQPMFREGDPLPYAVVTALSDITKRKQHEDNALQLGIERKRIELLAGFIRDASHEFRTPLSIIQTSLYLLNKSQSMEIREQKSRVIEEQVRSIAHLVSLLGIQADLDSQSSQAVVEPLNLNDVLRELYEELQPKANRQQKSLALKFTNAPIWVMGNENQLVIGLAQIVENALRYTQQGGAVMISTSIEHPSVKIDIKNSGVGIPSEVLAHIYERFYRRDVAHTSPGFGLGLSIAARIIDNHHGQITVESAPEVGSIFSITLPLVTNGTTHKEADSQSV